jgi:hypothetical protein
MLRRCIGCAAFLLLAGASFAASQQASATPPLPSTPLPLQVISAKSIFVSNAPWDKYCHVYKGGPERGYNSFYADLQQWHHYQLVTASTSADLVFEMSCKSPETNSVFNGQGITTDHPEVLLRILDPKTGVVLWTLTEQISPGVLAKSRDKEFDKALASLIEQLKQRIGA